MDVKNKKHETPKHQIAAEPGIAAAAAQSIMDHGAEVYGQAEQAVSVAYDKTAEAVCETYEKAKNYSRVNPGKTILIALGLGVGLGLLLRASSHHSRTGRFARPVVNALSEIALEFFH